MTEKDRQRFTQMLIEEAAHQAQQAEALAAIVEHIQGSGASGFLDALSALAKQRHSDAARCQVIAKTQLSRPHPNAGMPFAGSQKS